MSATVDLLHDRGFWRLATADIAAKAGMSRGALTHHFASREEIIVRAIQSMLERVTLDLLRFAEELEIVGGSSDTIVDYLWRMMSDRLYYVTLEYLPEARHNKEFRVELIPVVRAFHAGLDAVWAALARQNGIEPKQASIVLNATMCLFRGMLAQTILRDDPAYYAELRAFWKVQVRQCFESLQQSQPRVASKRRATVGRR